MEMSEVRRVSPEEARRRLVAGRALLVCGYEGEDEFRSMRLEGAESLHQFRSRLPALPKDQEVVFYCS